MSRRNSNARGQLSELAREVERIKRERRRADRAATRALQVARREARLVVGGAR